MVRMARDVDLPQTWKRDLCLLRLAVGNDPLTLEAATNVKECCSAVNLHLGGRLVLADEQIS
jgi:hypothetical protein